MLPNAREREVGAVRKLAGDKCASLQGCGTSANKDGVACEARARHHDGLQLTGGLSPGANDP